MQHLVSLGRRQQRQRCIPWLYRLADSRPYCSAAPTRALLLHAVPGAPPPVATARPAAARPPLAVAAIPLIPLPPLVAIIPHAVIRTPLPLSGAVLQHGRWCRGLSGEGTGT